MPLKNAVNKINESGDVVATYSGIKETRIKEHTSSSTIAHLISSGKLRKGFRFEYADKRKVAAAKKVQNHITDFPWERDGLFCERGWAKVCY